MNMLAVFFDMDGLIFDTETLFVNITLEIAVEQDLKLNKKDLIKIIGTTEEHTEQMLKERFRDDFSYWDMYDQYSKRKTKYFQNYGMPIKKGAIEILEFLNSRSIPKALVTSTTMDVVEEYFSITNIKKYFQEVVTGDQVKNSKPDPEIYIKAANLLGKNPNDGIAFEDSINGLKSAKRAGMQTIMIPDTIAYDPQNKVFIDKVFNSLDLAIPYLKDMLNMVF